MILVYLDFTDDCVNEDYILYKYPNQWVFTNPQSSSNIIEQSANKHNVLQARYSYFIHYYANQLRVIYNDIVIFLPIDRFLDNLEFTRNCIRQADVLLSSFKFVNINNKDYQTRYHKFLDMWEEKHIDNPPFDIDLALENEEIIDEIKGILNGNNK